MNEKELLAKVIVLEKQLKELSATVITVDDFKSLSKAWSDEAREAAAAARASSQERDSSQRFAEGSSEISFGSVRSAGSVDTEIGIAVEDHFNGTMIGRSVTETGKNVFKYKVDFTNEMGDRVKYEGVVQKVGNAWESTEKNGDKSTAKDVVSAIMGE